MSGPTDDGASAKFAAGILRYLDEVGYTADQAEELTVAALERWAAGGGEVTDRTRELSRMFVARRAAG